MDPPTTSRNLSAPSVKRSMSLRALPPVPRQPRPVYTDVVPAPPPEDNICDIPENEIYDFDVRSTEKAESIQTHLQVGIDVIYDTPLSKLLTKFKLPLVVTLAKYYKGIGSDISIKKNDTLILHFLRRERRSILCERQGQKEHLPIQTDQLYDVLSDNPQFDGEVFLGTMSVIRCKPLPKKLRITKMGSPSSDVNICAGALLKISHVERKAGENSATDSVLVGTCNGHPFRIPQSMTSYEYSTVISDDPLTMSDIVDKHVLPVRVRRVDNKIVYRLLECIIESSVIATRKNYEHVLSIPVSSEMVIQKVDNFEMERFLKGMLPALYPLMKCDGNVVELDSGITMKNEKQQTTDTQEGPGIREGSLHDELSRQIMERSRRKSTGIGESKPPSKQSGRRLSHDTPLTKPASQGEKKPIPTKKPSIPRSSSISGNLFKSSFAREKPPSGSDEISLSNEPPPLPPDRLKSRRGSLPVSLTTPREHVRLLHEFPKASQESARPQEEPQKPAHDPPMEYDTAFNLRDADLEQVLKFLEFHKFDKFVEPFRKEMVTGDLLCELGLTELHEDLGMPKVQAKRLLSIIRKMHLV